MSTTAQTPIVRVPLPTLEEAKQDVEQAAASLEALLADLRVAPRAEKTAVSAAIEQALSRLRHAREKLAEAQTALPRETEASE